MPDHNLGLSLIISSHVFDIGHSGWQSQSIVLASEALEDTQLHNRHILPLGHEV